MSTEWDAILPKGDFGHPVSFASTPNTSVQGVSVAVQAGVCSVAPDGKGGAEIVDFGPVSADSAPSPSYGSIVRDFWRSATGKKLDRDENPGDVWCEPYKGAPGSVAYTLFEHMSREHRLTLSGSELDEIIRVVNSALEERLLWWIANAESIAKERGELFRAGEEMCSIIAGHGWAGTEAVAWDAAAQPIRDMISAFSAKTESRTPTTETETL